MGKHRKSGMHLRSKIHQTVLDNQRQPTGDRWLLEIDGCLHLYHHDEDLFIGKHLSQRLAAEQGWFEKLIAHAPSVGTFYEDSLRALVSDVLPASLKVGTGFIFDPETKRHSRQLDILVYDDSRRAPLYRRADFVVITPEIAVAQSEVKKTLRLSDVRDLINTTVASYFGQHYADPPNCQRLSIFSYSSPSKTHRIFDEAAETLLNYVHHFEAETESGSRARLAMCSVVLPQFCFFDRKNYIETRLRARTDGAYDVTISEYVASTDNALGEYLHEMTMSHGAYEDVGERDFRTLPLRNVLKETVLPSKIHLFRRIPVVELLNYFRDDRHEIRDFRVDGERPHTVFIPSRTDISNVGSFDEFKALPGVSWWTA